ncbi:MAG: 2-C-methyl-D-erythritol 4-phosphate cytidylyltransferase [Porphyromonas sp.]|nr:2-C-methyl-D-erythritol 4-phosphate cytidylyltransferase [Porphyromonas sp.]
MSRIGEKWSASLSFLIVAGGSGRRMGRALPKQYLEVHGVPILIHTLRNISQLFDQMPEMVLVVPKGDVDFVTNMIEEWGLDHLEIKICTGGSTRYESVWNGLKECNRELVAVHDAVRPFVTAAMMERLLGALEEGRRAVVPTIPSVDSIRLVSDEGSNAPFPRERVQLVQTPQCFSTEVLKEGYLKFISSPMEHCTDEASIVTEMLSESPHLVAGDERNIKITTPKDLILAEFFAQQV